MGPLFDMPPGYKVSKDRKIKVQTQLAIDPTLVEGDLRESEPVLRKNFNANYNNAVGEYLRNGLNHISYSWKEGSRYALMTDASHLESFEIKPKGKNNGSFTRYNNDFFAEMKFVDKLSYSHVPTGSGKGWATFKVEVIGQDMQMPGLRLTISAPEQTGRADELARQRRENVAVKPDKAIYKEAIRLRTLQVMRLYGHLIGNQHLKHIPGVQVDHILSQDDGFKLGIPIELIACVSNLQYLTGSDNASKGARSDQTENQLKTAAIRAGYFDFDTLDALYEAMK